MLRESWKIKVLVKSVISKKRSNALKQSTFVYLWLKIIINYLLYMWNM